MHLFKRWQPYLLISILLAFSMLISVLYRDAITTPNDNWSKTITLDTTSNVENSDLYYASYYDVIADDQHFIYADIVNNTLNVKVFDDEVNLIEHYSYDVSIDSVEQISLTKESNQYKILAATGNSLYQLVIPSHFNDAITSKKVIENYDHIVIKKNKAVYQLNETIYALSDADIMEIVNDSRIELFDFDFNEKNNLYIAAITYENGKYFATTYDYDLSTHECNSFDIANLHIPSSTVPLETRIFYNDENVYTLFSLKNTKYGQNINFYYKLDSNTQNSVENTSFTNKSYAPQFNFELYKDSVVLIYSDETFIGKTDLSSQENTFSNIILSTSFDLSAMPLTNNQVTEQNPHMLTLNGHAYLFTNAYTNHTNILQVSSTHPNLIKVSQHLSFNAMTQLIFNGLTYVPASLMALFAPFILLIFPVVLIILPVAIIKMSWAEKHQNKMLLIALATYHLSKIYYLWANRSDLVIHNVGIGTEPWHLSNIFFLFLTGLFTSLVSMLCLRVYTRGKKQPYFITQFAFFYGIEIIQFLFYYVIFTIVFIPNF